MLPHQHNPALSGIQVEPPEQEELYSLVQTCPHCGSPIYAPMVIRAGKSAPRVLRTCRCAKDLRAAAHHRIAMREHELIVERVQIETEKLKLLRDQREWREREMEALAEYERQRATRPRDQGKPSEAQIASETQTPQNEGSVANEPRPNEPRPNEPSADTLIALPYSTGGAHRYRIREDGHVLDATAGALAPEVIAHAVLRLIGASVGHDRFGPYALRPPAPASGREERADEER